jgi:hypothetical protein
MVYDIDIEFNLGNEPNDVEDYYSSIRDLFLDLLLDELDIAGQCIFHSIERTMKSDTTQALFSKQNEILCNSILSDLDSWLIIKLYEALQQVAFHKEAEVRVLASAINKRETQNQVKFNVYVYASRISKRFFSHNPNGATESFDTAPVNTPKHSINLTYADAAAVISISQDQYPTPYSTNDTMPDPTSNHDVPSVSSNDNISRRVELESSIISINSERLSFQADHQILRA